MLKRRLLRVSVNVALGFILFCSFSLFTPLWLAPTRSQPVLLAQGAANRFQTLAEADRLYLDGQTDAATSLYRQAKPDFPDPPTAPRVIPIYETDSAQLTGAMGVYWRNAIEGMNSGLDSQTFISLHALTQDYPEFIPGHLKLAEACAAQPQSCASYAAPGQPTSAAEVLERATNLYPDEPDLLRAKVTALANAEEFLQASIAARQFSQIYIDYPEAPEFAALADEYLQRYESRNRRQLEREGWFNAVLGVGSAILTGEASQGISGLQTVLLLGKGESRFGEETASALSEQYRQQGTLVEESEILNYVTGIAQRFTPYVGRDFEYEFYVVKDSTMNAFALPGGKVFVNTGAILGTNSEAELAGLLSHEISHAALSHGFQSVAQSNLLSSLQQVFPLNDLVYNLSSSQHSQAQERQADALGTRVLASSGYAADGLRNLMATLSQQDGSAASGPQNALVNWLATHPASSERVRYIEQLIQDNGYNRYAYEGVEKHLEIQNRLQGVMPDAAPVAQSPAPQPPAAPSAQASAPSSPSPGAGATHQPVTGEVVLVTSQDQNQVIIRLDGANASRTSFTANLIVENHSDRPFGFVPSFVEVVTASGEELSSRLVFDTDGDTLVQPGGQLTGQLSVFGHTWQNTGSQGLTLTIREGTTGGRTFRLGF